MPDQNFKGFFTQSNEITDQSLTINGDIPRWLSGDFVSNGPAQFEVGSTNFNHWLDGFAMLKKFSFRSGQVSFQNRFLRSNQFVNSHALGHLSVNEFATYASPTALGRIKNAIGDIFKGGVYDNCNVNILQIASRYIAMTESSNTIEFNIHDLATVGAFEFDDNIDGQLGTAHPKLDAMTGEMINVAIKIGKKIEYHVYKIKPHNLKRELIQTYVSDRLFYMHSFSITENYVVLFKSPLTVNKFKLLFGLPFYNTLSLVNDASSFFIVIDRRSGNVQEIETDAFVCLHGANAYEHHQELVLDLICYDAENPYSSLFLNNLRQDRPKLPAGTLKRYVLDMRSKRCTVTPLAENSCEFPAIHHHSVSGKKYNYLYCNALVGDNLRFLNSIQKTQVQTGKTQVWKKNNYYPGEVVFVARDQAKSEDDGILLGIVFDASKERSLLVIIDALTMQEVAEVFLPFSLPFGLHGDFYSNQLKP